MAILTRDQIVNVDDLEVRTVDVPEWGGEVNIRTMTGTERDAFEDSLFVQKGKSREANYDNLRSKLLARCIVGEDKKRLFSDKEIVAVGQKNAKVLDRLYEIASELNGIGPKEEEALTKNSESEGNDTSISPSPKNSE